MTNEAGEVTSHLNVRLRDSTTTSEGPPRPSRASTARAPHPDQGFFYRTIKFLEHGVKPVYVFDGKPPELKSGELAKRREIKEKAETDLAAAIEAGNDEDVERFTKRTVRIARRVSGAARRAPLRRAVAR